MATIRLLRHNKYVFSCVKQKHEANYLLQVRNQSKTASESIVKFSNGKTMTFSTGKLARMADGSAVATLGDTSVMVTTVSETQSHGSSSFVPLTVDYKQKASAAGRIPTNFFRRELGRTEHEILTSRLIDRSVRPLFPYKYNCQTQVMCNILALDGNNDPDILSINGASAALAVSDIPWNGPVGAVRVGLVDNEILINPTRCELQQSMLNLIVTAAHQNLVVMLEGCANNIQLPELMKALKAGVKECQNIIHEIQNLRKKIGKTKRTVEEPAELSPETQSNLKSLSETPIREIFTNYEHDKLSRDNAINNLRNEILNKMKENDPELNMSLATEAFADLCKNTLRNLILETGKRCDGRKLTDIRDIKCQVDLFKPLHGSALFQRGQTQVLCTVTLDSPDSALKMDTMTMLASGIKEKNFFLHYEFPPYATNETGRAGPINRREMGHGALAERGLRAVIPEDYPFTIRLTSEVMESNGSSSMASVCGGSLALMDAGVPISSSVAGIAMGLVTDGNKDPKSMDYRILSDILGIEDYFGDMDFKIAGSRKGVTALQADIKVSGLPLKIVMDALQQSHEGRALILNTMSKEIMNPRLEKKANMPVTETINVPVHLKGKLLGVGGSNIKKIFLQTGVHINQQEDSQFVLFAPNQAAMNEAKEIVNGLIKHEREPTLEFGGIYTAKIVELKDIGVMITLYPGMQPTLLHNTQLDQRLVNHPSALDLKVGQEIQIKYFGRDPVSGSMRLSRKVLQTTNFPMKNFSKASS